MASLGRRVDAKHLPHSLEEFYEDLQGAPNMVNEAEAVASGAVALTLDPSVYGAEITTGGTAGSEDVNLGDGTGAVVGQRKLITLSVRTNASDVVNLDHANMVNAAGTTATNVDLDAAGEFVLLEWNGAKWQVVYTNGTVAP